MPIEHVLTLLQQAAMVGVRTVSFSGGEPFVHPGIRQILRAAVDGGLEVELVTNGTLVKPSDIPLLEQVKCVTVSIDGTAPVHDYVRGRAGCWDSTMKTVRLLAASGATWGTNTVMQKDNAEVLYDTWRGIRDQGRPAYVGFTHVEVVPETEHLLIPGHLLESARQQVARARTECDCEGIFFNDGRILGEHFDVFADKTRRYRPVQGCPIPQVFLGVTAYGYFPCWHQGRHIEAASLLEALRSPVCDDVVREAQERRCCGCNAANYSWSEDWVEGILEAHRRGDYEDGTVHLSQPERVAGSLRAGKRTIPLLERVVSNPV